MEVDLGEFRKKYDRNTFHGSIKELIKYCTRKENSDIVVVIMKTSETKHMHYSCLIHRVDRQECI